MSKITNFLKSHQIKDGIYTHTSMKGGKYLIKNEELDDFYKILDEYLFTNNIKNENYISITEVCEKITNVKIDIDLVLHENLIERQFDTSDIIKIINIYNSAIKQILDVDINDLTCFIFTREHPYKSSKTINKEKQNIIKDGIHIIYPYLVCATDLQHKIRDFAINLFKKEENSKIFKFMNALNDITDIIDKNIINITVWTMYGCSKHIKNDEYHLPYLFNGSIDSNLTYEQYEPRISSIEMIKLLSTRFSAKTGYKITTPHENLDEIIFEKPKTKVKEIKKEKENNDVKIDQQPINVKRSNYNEYEKIVFTNMPSTKLESYSDYIRVVYYFAQHLCFEVFDQYIFDNGNNEHYQSNKHIDHYNSSVKNDYKASLKQVMDIWKQIDIESYNLNYKNVWNLFYENYVFNINNTDVDIANFIYNIITENGIFNIYSLHDSSFYYYNDKKWVIDTDQINIKSLITTVCYDNLNEIIKNIKLKEAKKNLTKIRDQFMKMKNIKNYIDALKLLLSFDSENFYKLLDQQDNLIIFNNGVYDLDTCKFSNHKPRYMNTFNLSYDFIEFNDFDRENFNNNKSYDILSDEYLTLEEQYYNNLRDDIDDYDSIIEQYNVKKDLIKFLTSLLDKDELKYLMHTFAYGLHGYKTIPRFNIFYGKSASNGKSTLFSLLSNSLENYSLITDNKIFTDNSTDGNKSSSLLYALKNKRFFLIEELPECKLKANTIKKLSVGSTLNARELFEKQSQFEIKGMFFLSSNNLINLDSDDNGINRRLVNIEFKYHFCDKNNIIKKTDRVSDPNISLKFKNNLYKQQFMLLLLKIWNYKVKKVTPDELLEIPNVIKNSTNEVKINNDELFDFFNEYGYYFSPDENDYISVGNLYDEYKNYINNIDPKIQKLDRKNFNDRLKKNNYVIQSQLKEMKLYPNEFGKLEKKRSVYVYHMGTNYNINNFLDEKKCKLSPNGLNIDNLYNEYLTFMQDSKYNENNIMICPYDYFIKTLNKNKLSCNEHSLFSLN